MSDEIQARQLVVFTLGAEQYALPIEQVHEIIRYDEPRSVASGRVGARRDQPARADHPRLRPRRSPRHRPPSRPTSRTSSSSNPATKPPA